MDKEPVYQVRIEGKAEPEDSYDDANAAITAANEIAKLDQFTGAVEVFKVTMRGDAIGSEQVIKIHRVRG